MPLLSLATAAAGADDRADVRLSWPDGEIGLGDAKPDPDAGVSAGTLHAALDAYASVLADADPGAGHADLLAACAAERLCPPALAAVDMALWDRAARAAGVPVAALLAPGHARRVFVAAPIDAIDREGAARQAAQAAAQGYICVRVEVARGDDAGRLAAVRAAAGPRMAIRIAAGGRWADPDEALANLRALVGCGIELIEEPVRGLEALAAVRGASPIPVAMEAAAAEPHAAGAGAVDAVGLRVSRCGGISGLMQQGQAARRAGAHLYVTTGADGPLATAAAFHAAAALSVVGPVAPCGLEAGFGAPGGSPGLGVEDGMVAVPLEPGLLGSTAPIR